MRLYFGAAQRNAHRRRFRWICSRGKPQSGNVLSNRNEDSLSLRHNVTITNARVNETQRSNARNIVEHFFFCLLLSTLAPHLIHIRAMRTQPHESFSARIWVSIGAWASAGERAWRALRESFSFSSFPLFRSTRDREQKSASPAQLSLRFTCTAAWFLCLSFRAPLPNRRFDFSVVRFEWQTSRERAWGKRWDRA